VLNLQIFLTVQNDRFYAPVGTKKRFIQPSFDLWPPNSPYLNPVDYKIWGVMQQRVYESRINELKQRLHEVWHGEQQH